MHDERVLKPLDQGLCQRPTSCVTPCRKTLEATLLCTWPHPYTDTGLDLSGRRSTYANSACQAASAFHWARCSTCA